MRDPNRLYKFYNTLLNKHLSTCPDWRFSQLMLNFFIWHKNKYKTDGFYIEEDVFLTRFDEFINVEVKGCY